ncbi:hypothetical protein RZS08_51405, partial [Arthrospira platensis SPKY1]|nr:hypothetical protein [Arthrospira platensis SPKY1]
MRPPLDAKQGLVVSDVVLGYGRGEGEEWSDLTALKGFDFFVPPSAEVPMGRTLSLYFEVYGLQGDEPSFELSYTLLKAGSLGAMQPIADRTTTRTVFLAQGSRHVVELDIDLDGLDDEGRYRLAMEVRDRVSDGLAKQDVEFVLLDPERRMQEASDKLSKR